MNEEERKKLVRLLAEVVGPENVSDRPEITIGYSRDHATYLRFGWKSRSPDIVVMPSTTAEVQNIVKIARQFKVPLIPMGSGLNMRGWAIPNRGGILIDLKRMDRIISIDEDSMVAIVQTGVPILKLQCELLKRRMFIHQPGAPSTVQIGSHWVHGNANKVGARLGLVDEQVVGWEIVLPDATILRTGSLADVYLNEAFWPYGPGPNLGHLPRYSEGNLGIVTTLAVKCHPLDEVLKPFWVAFDDIEDGIKAYIEFLHMEIGTGSSFYSGYKYCLYGLDFEEAAERSVRIHPEFMLILTFMGTPRRIEYEEQVVREIAEKYGGRIITDKLPFYQMFVDTHINMASSLYSEYTQKYFQHPGSVGHTAGQLWIPVKVVPRFFKVLTKLQLEDPDLRDPDLIDAALNRSLILYPIDGGHYVMWESVAAGYPTDPILFRINPRFVPKLIKAMKEEGVPVDLKYVVQRPGEMGISETFQRLMWDFQKALDPDSIMETGAWYIYR